MAFPDPSNPMDAFDLASGIAGDKLSGRLAQPSMAQSKYSADGRGARYDVFACTARYSYNDGLLHLPVAAGIVPTGSAFVPSESDPCYRPTTAQRTASVFVRLHAPICRLTVTYYARRTGAQPRVPKPCIDDDNLVLLTADTIPSVPVLDDSGVLYVYDVTAVYVYGLLKPVTDVDGFRVGAAPFDEADPDDHSLDPESFVDDILAGDPGAGGALVPPKL